MMIRHIHRSQRSDFMIKKQSFYWGKRYEVFISKYISYGLPPKTQISPFRIGEQIDMKFKHNCKLCEFYTNQYLLYERHINSNNHFIRKNQF
jgi:hypothetical protein